MPRKRTKAEKEAIIRSIKRRCRGPLSEEGKADLQAAFDAGNLDLARRMDREGRPGCGADTNDLILSEALDGKQHAGECFACGAEQTWRPAPLDLERVEDI